MSGLSIIPIYYCPKKVRQFKRNSFWLRVLAPLFWRALVPLCREVGVRFLLLSFLLGPSIGFSQDGISGKLPDLLLSENGQPIHNVADWENIRRPELLQLFKKEMYGEMPENSTSISYKIIESASKVFSGLATRKQVRLFFSASQDKHFVDLLIYYPTNIHKSVPVFLGYNFAGNQSISVDKNILLTNSWVPAKTNGSANNRATDSTRGIATADWPIERILKSGYALATMYAGDVAPDYADGFKEGIQSLLPALQNRDDNFSTMSAWAWGLSRAVDYLETDKAIDSKKIIVIGSSRMGKAALWAGAIDPRFAMVISNESGAGGAKLFHHVGGEDTRNICKRFPYWFCNNFLKYNGRDTLMPFDQHQLLALIAPRPLYVAGATGSVVTDSYGEFLSAKYASPVYQFYNKEGLRITDFPPVNTPSFGTIGYHLREGNHGINLYDWEQFIAFANLHFFQKSKKEKPMDLYLLIGQSNMAGRGPLTEAYEQIRNENVWMLDKENNWVPAKHPLHFDKPKAAGVGPGLSFGIAMAKKNKKHTIGLIPCAVGGTSIDVWQPGGFDKATNTHPYDDMLLRLNEAMKSGTLKGVIWLQGESDSSPEKAAAYLSKLETLIQRLRSVANNPSLPFVAGELGQYRQEYQNINKELARLPVQVANTAIATSEKLTDKGDQTHFDSKSATEYGKRFAKKMKALLKKRLNNA